VIRRVKVIKQAKRMTTLNSSVQVVNGQSVTRVLRLKVIKMLRVAHTLFEYVGYRA